MFVSPSRKRFLYSFTLFGALLLLITACGGGASAPTAQQLISSAQTAFQKATSYHFNLKVDNPGAGQQLVIQTADGDVVTPDKLRATANALVLGNVVQVKLITVGTKNYMTNPITGTWGPTTAIFDPRSFSDPQKGMPAILGNIKNPGTPADSSVDGTSCWSIDGTLDAKYLAGILGSNAAAGSQTKITTCIGKTDNLPYLIRITGAAAQGDTAQTVHTFKLSKYGESVTITAPI